MPQAPSPRIVFFPGASGAGAFWAPVAARMPPDWGTRWLDWPGAGQQPHDASLAGYNDLVALAADRVADGSDVVAQSIGGAVAIGLALAHPRKVRRLVLVATSGGLDVTALGVEDWREPYAVEFPHAAPWVRAEHLDYTRELGSLRVPTCLIWGDADPISPLAVGRRLESLLPDSTLHVLGGGTHVVAEERPDEVAGLVIQHLG
jgi:pimeloyl-ACP methyl ester carboxylesterase